MYFTLLSILIDLVGKTLNHYFLLNLGAWRDLLPFWNERKLCLEKSYLMKNFKNYLQKMTPIQARNPLQRLLTSKEAPILYRKFESSQK